MPLPPSKIAILHYQLDGDPVDPVVLQVGESLRKLGHQPSFIAVSDRVFDILQEIERSGCDLVFNLCETFAEDYRLEVNVAALMEMARVKFTGSGTAGLLLAQDKILTKQLLEYHEIPTPDFATFDGSTVETNGDLAFPLIVKPARSDASIGIGGKSLVNSWEQLTDRVREIRKELRDEALAEEFIQGREVYVGIIGTKELPEILPIVELDFGNWDKDKPTISDREVKFGPETEGSPKLVIARDISPVLRQRVERAALLAYRALKLQDYARIDLRISEQDDPYILEVNPNPYLEDKGELALAAREKGLSYTQLIGRILDSAGHRYGLMKKPAPTAQDSATAPAMG
ncbi:D-alanine--D-alanine ligase family protein [Stigmatella aurantiaca]|uniref:D-ala D-ala ligase C-terminus family n=1 Tax=Stigmatella aurantiaca (strain DW4/3-1) TaxID=378806 RepID=Q08QR9_STIAD|nr:ATP-grasp domain-containing protein [Stigmatella aurantiaca]ADO71567.1 D-ala D-ala ligase family [Stigmatella aurantiaca DW4/3-1]EAU62830.1 D-ala D-ala ligase C-terminus family [Stigmatella aurantiaca DW4/3-1]